MLHTCPNPYCAQTYALNETTLLASPGTRSEPERVQVPDVDVWGQGSGTRWTTSSTWRQAGPSIQANKRRANDVTYVTSWPCPCGTTLDVASPVMVRLDCTHDAPQGGVCRVRGNQVKPPSDLYVNARHGARCECCGHQGTHLIRADKAGVMPRCLRP